MGGRLLCGAAKGLKRSNSAQSVCLAHNKQLTECNCANPYVAVITREINGFLPIRADPTAACQRPPATQKDLARGRAGAAGCWALRGDPGWQGGPCACLTNSFYLLPFLTGCLARTWLPEDSSCTAHRVPALPIVHSFPSPPFSPNCCRISRLFLRFFW